MSHGLFLHLGIFKKRARSAAWHRMHGEYLEGRVLTHADSGESGIADGREALTRTRACDGKLGAPNGVIEGLFLDHETGVMTADTSRCVGKFQSRQPVLKPGPLSPLSAPWWNSGAFE